MREKKEKPIKIRQTWSMNPVERVKESNKIYSRKKPYCPDCNAVGMAHCSDFIHCGGAIFSEEETEE